VEKISLEGGKRRWGDHGWNGRPWKSIKEARGNSSIGEKKRVYKGGPFLEKRGRGSSE